MASPSAGLRQQALWVLQNPVAAEKAQQAQALHERARHESDALACAAAEVIAPPPADALPGRPARPELVTAREVPARSPYTLEGRAALLHAICHIEFNAINLALDAVWRFGGMPAEFYADWLKVASEEALHFSLLRAHLQTMGFDYGDFPAHQGLWAMCERTTGDVMARMALVPRTLEARGLDATPPIQAKLLKAGDVAAKEILDIILRDEVGHVAVGNRWFRHLCLARGLDATQVYPELVRLHDAPKLRPPYNVEARLRAGFTDAEMRFLLGEEG